MKNKAIEKLKSWSEDAINCAELEIEPNVKALREHILEARAAGLSVDEIESLIWTPYAEEALKP